MSGMNLVDPVLEWFKGRMRRKLALAKNVKKKSWHTMDDDSLMQRIKEECDELDRVFVCYPDKKQSEDIINEAADVANFCMMLADNARRYASRTPEAWE